MVIIKNSNIHGKGVFASVFIPCDTVLHCDVLRVTANEYTKDYVFPFIGSSTCLHIGFGSFLNSSNLPNLKHIGINTVEKISYFQAIRDIEESEELTLRYMK